MKPKKIALLGSGFIASHYLMFLHGLRNADRVQMIYGRNEEKLKNLAAKWGIPKYSTSMKEAVEDPDVGVVVIGLPNHQHKEAILTAVEANKPVLCTKPLARNATEAKEILESVEKAGVFHGYLEDLVYTPKMLKTLKSVQAGSLGQILWVRSREAHPGPHSDWFWSKEFAGGGALIDLGCHCVEIGRNYIGKEVKPLEVMCWADTQVKPIEAEDHAIALVKYANGAIGQFEVSWAFRGGMDLRDELEGTEGTVWINHFLRTGLEMFTSIGEGGYTAEKAESDTGWLFPVADEVSALGYGDMFSDMFDSIDNGGTPMETFYDGYVVNAILDACYVSAKSKKWEPINLEIWRGSEEIAEKAAQKEYDDQYYLVKEEKLMDGTVKLILKDKKSGAIIQKDK